MPKRLTRRSFMVHTAAAAALPLLPARAAASTGPITELTARASTVQLVSADYPETQIWGYDGMVPGPTIRVAQNTPVRRRLINALPQDTAVHWHGIRLENAMDGVPGMTQAAVAPGASFDYDFLPPDAGTYWYHSHNFSNEQVARGLYGPLIIDEAAAPDVDEDLVVLYDDWRLDEGAQVHDSFGAMHDLSHGGRMGNFVDAFVRPQIDKVKTGQRLRLRLINVATDRIAQLSLQGMTGWVMAQDGMPLTTPRPAERLVLAPAQRIDIFADVTAGDGAEAIIVEHDRGEAFVLTAFRVAGQAARTARTAPAPLPPNPVTAPVMDADTFVADLTMQGGAMGGLSRGIYKGQELSMRALVAQGQVWTLNTVAGLPETPLAALSRGQTARINMVNDTAFPHGIHMHGHHFNLINPDGSLGDLRDTVLVAPGRTQPVAFVADNPGSWLIHCHMLSHQVAGMKTWFTVS